MAETLVREKDLPDPGILPASSGQTAERQWRLWNVVNAVLLIYAVIHKVGVPLVKGVPIWSTDIWWIYHVVLLFPLRKRAEKMSAILAWFGFGFCIARLALLHSMTWVSMSVTLTEGFSALFLLLFLQSNVIRTYARSWRTVLFFLVGILAAAAALPEVNPYGNRAAVSSKASNTKSTVMNETSQCTNAKVPASTLLIQSCGFSTSTLHIDKELNIVNSSGRFLNLRFEKKAEGPDGVAWHFVKNIPVFTGQGTKVDSTVLPAGGTYRVRSDSWPEAGVVTLD